MTKSRFYVEIDVDDAAGVAALAVHDALYEADSRALLHQHGVGFVNDISVAQVSRRPRSVAEQWRKLDEAYRVNDDPNHSRGVASDQREETT